MRRSGQPSRPRARICCLLSSPKMLAIPAGNHALHRRVNVLGRRYFTGRFSGVHDWPVLVSTEDGTDVLAVSENGAPGRRPDIHSHSPAAPPTQTEAHLSRTS